MSGTVNLNTINSKFHFIQSFCNSSVKCFPTISCLKCTDNSNFHLIRRNILPMNDFELTVPDLYMCEIDLLNQVAQINDQHFKHSSKILHFYKVGHIISDAAALKYIYDQVNSIRFRDRLLYIFRSNVWKNVNYKMQISLISDFPFNFCNPCPESNDTCSSCALWNFTL